MYAERQDTVKISSKRRLLATALLMLGVVQAPQTASAEAPSAPAPAPVIEQQALDHLKAMSDKLTAAKAFTYRSRSAIEVPAKTGQYLTHFIESDVALERPNKLRSKVSGDLPHYQFYYDGSTVSALDIEKNLYAIAKAPGTIDEMLPFVMEKAGIDFPAADFLLGNPYAELTKGLTHAIAVGPVKVNGVPSEHYAYMSPAVNWEVWIDANSLPRRLAVTHKSVDNFPRFQVEFLDWNLNPKLSASEFVLKKPQGAKEVEFGAKMENPPR